MLKQWYPTVKRILWRAGREDAASWPYILVKTSYDGSASRFGTLISLQHSAHGNSLLREVIRMETDNSAPNASMASLMREASSTSGSRKVSALSMTRKVFWRSRYPRIGPGVPLDEIPRFLQTRSMNMWNVIWDGRRSSKGMKDRWFPNLPMIPESWRMALASELLPIPPVPSNATWQRSGRNRMLEIRSTRPSRP